MRLQAKINLCLFVLFIVANMPQVSGIVFHEWISVVFLIPFVIHLLLDWNWITRTTTGFFGRLKGEVRFNYVWDWLMFIVMVIVTVSGFLISEALLPSIGIPIEVDPFWSFIHDVSAGLLMTMVGIHLAMHWDWIKKAWRLFFPSSPATATESQPRPAGNDQVTP